MRSSTTAHQKLLRHARVLFALTVLLPSCSTRDGTYRDQVRHPDGTLYVGEFRDGMPHGQGTLSYPDGRERVGEFQAGKPVGNSELLLEDLVTKEQFFKR